MGKFRKTIYTLSILTLSAIFFVGCGATKGEKAFDEYAKSWKDKDFNAMYSMLSENSKKYIDKESFLERYNNIYEAIEAKNIEIETTGKAESSKETAKIPFKLSMDTTAGKLEMKDFRVDLVEENGEFKVEWDESLIFSNMEKGDKVRVETVYANRGRILDKNDKVLAQDGEIAVIGIHPAVFEAENKDAKIKNLASILDISEEVIIKKLEANTNPDQFVPIVDIGQDNPKLSEIEKIADQGYVINKKKSRVYINENAFGRLLGYVGPITKEELEKNKDKGYLATDYIGKAGIEQISEEQLRGKEGKEIYIDRYGEKVPVLKTDALNGKDIKLSIDSDLQVKIYNEMNGEKGGSTAINPKTGEVLAMVSAPSYNSNEFMTYTTKTQSEENKKNNYANQENRFTKLYSPGSTMKLMTSVIGLETGTINPDQKIAIKGKAWQKDASWGNYKVTRVTDPQKDVDLKDANKYSDNIYFAKAALDIGADKYTKGLSRFGIGEELAFDYPLNKSQISNDGKLDKDILLADTGYGQGQVMMSPLDVTLCYSALVNDGNIMKPTLFVNETNKPSVWKEEAIKKDNLPKLIDIFSSVVNDADGTGNDAKIEGINIAAKSGTAEIKKTQDDKDGTENGWFAAVDTENPRIAISMVIEDVKGRGGSHVVSPRVKNVLEYYLKK